MTILEKFHSDDLLNENLQVIKKGSLWVKEYSLQWSDIFKFMNDSQHFSF